MSATCYFLLCHQRASQAHVIKGIFLIDINHTVAIYRQNHALNAGAGDGGLLRGVDSFGLVVNHRSQSICILAQRRLSEATWFNHQTATPRFLDACLDAIWLP